MKFLILLFLIPFNVLGANYYVSANGNDNNIGTIGLPFKTLQKVNSIFSTLNPGDGVFFEGGYKYYGSLIVSKDGTAINKITIDSYGNGMAEFTGFSTAINWGNNIGGVWQCNAAGAKNDLAIVTVNNLPQEIGRYPNANASNGGYLNFEQINTVPTSFIDNQLTSSPNYTGADVVIRKKHWVHDICKINNHSGTLIDYTNPSGTDHVYDGSNNFGYFIQNDSRTLDQSGEWYRNTTSGILSMYFGSTIPGTIQYSTVDTIINVGSASHILIQNINITGGGKYGVYAKNGTNITVKNCSIKNCLEAVYCWNIFNLLIENNAIDWALNNGIYIYNFIANNTIIKGNSVTNVGLFDGLAGSGDRKGCAIWFYANNAVCEYNYVNNIGYNGIQYDGSNVTIRYNVVSFICKRKDDGGGYYTWSNNGATTFSNRVLYNNICMYAVGQPYGTDGLTNDDARGIYMDGGANNITAYNNFIYGCKGAGFYCNNIVNVVIKNNIVDSCKYGLSAQRFPNTQLLRNNIIDSNVFNCLDAGIFYWNGTINMPVPTTIQADFRAIATFSNNWYKQGIPAGDYFYHINSDAGQNNDGFTNPPAVDYTNWASFINESNTNAILQGYSSYYNASDKAILLNATYVDRFNNTVNTIAPFAANFLKPAAISNNKTFIIRGIKFFK